MNAPPLREDDESIKRELAQTKRELAQTKRECARLQNVMRLLRLLVGEEEQREEGRNGPRND